MESDVEETQAALVAQKVCAQSAGHAPRHQINSDGNLYRLAGRLTPQNGGFRPGQWRSPTSRSPRRPQRHAGRWQRRTRQPRGREEGFRRVVTESGIKIFLQYRPRLGRRRPRLPGDVQLAPTPLALLHSWTTATCTLTSRTAVAGSAVTNRRCLCSTTRPGHGDHRHFAQAELEA